VEPSPTERLRSGVAPALPRPQPVVAAYIPDYKLSSFAAEHTAGLTDLILFSVRPDAQGHVQDTRRLLERVHGIRAMAGTSLRLLLCVGGGGDHRSDGFSTVAADDQLRAEFIQQLVGIATKHGFDGIDVDWEHLSEPSDKQSYMVLLRDLRRALTPHHMLLTVAIDDPRELTAQGAQAVDRIHVMAYDGPRHGTLAQAQSKVQAALEQGIPPSKLVLGLPLYALGAGRNQAMPYDRLVEKYHPAPDADEVDGYRFSGVETSRQKVRYAREHNLAGVMFWELTQDAPGDASLIRSIAESLRSPNVPRSQ
jgi:chitinase